VEIDSTEGIQTTQVPLGEDVILYLPENPTTGYRWSVDADSLGAVLTLDDSTFAVATPAAGSGGTRRFQFSTVAPGTAQVNLSLVRSWQPDVPIDTYSLTVTVDAPEQLQTNP
jgi:inhibitor of cysteine peptidase